MIGNRLKLLRKAKGVNQEELAAVIGVKASAVSMYETDKNDPSDQIKVIIAKYFNTTLDYLLGIIDEPVPYYSQDAFLRLPEKMSSEEKILLSEFLEYLQYRGRTND